MQPTSPQSVPDTYHNVPLRPHPLSQELSRPRSPQPYAELPGTSPMPHMDAYNADPRAPIIKPQAVSPQPAPVVPLPQQHAERLPKTSYSIQYPVRAFESSDQSPLSNAQRPPQPTHRSSVPRKSVSPRPSLSTGSITPYGPDSFHVHNPNAKSSTLPSTNSPHSPYQISPDTMHQDESHGPIVGWHGQEIDPSDHLPVDSWAPEPEKKTPTKLYGLGRDRESGPRSTHGIGTANGRISKDTVVNVRMGSSTNEPEHSSASRNRLTKQNSPAPSRSPVDTPRHQHSFSSIPDPYAQPEFARHHDRGYDGSSSGYPPSLPPKVPVEYGHYGNDTDLLQRELASIDIGSSNSRHQRAGSVPAPAAYVPVKSHRDRMSYY
nr:hypothetical protein CFP56_79293 [Quercus suber]